MWVLLATAALSSSCRQCLQPPAYTPQKRVMSLISPLTNTQWLSRIKVGWWYNSVFYASTEFVLLLIDLLEKSCFCGFKLERTNQLSNVGFSGLLMYGLSCPEEEKCYTFYVEGVSPYQLVFSCKKGRFPVYVMNGPSYPTSQMVSHQHFMLPQNMAVPFLAIVDTIVGRG